MTKEEAIDILVGVIATNSEEENEALDMAIEALERTDTHECVKPTHECVDLISRRAALDALEWKWAGKAAIDAIKNLPSAVDVVTCKECEDVNKCHNYVVKKSASNGCIFCPLTFCSEGRRKK